MARGRGRRRSKSGSRAGRVFLALFLAVVFLAGVAAWAIFTPYGPENETFVEIEPGSSVLAIGRQLQSAGVVRNQFAFDLLRLAMRRRLKAGEYRFDHPAPATEVYWRIAHGDVYTRTVVVPEGANMFDIAARLESAGLGTREQFLRVAAHQTELVADLDPEAKSLEGYLFPDTYRFPRKATAEQIAATMVRRFRTVAGELGLRENVHDVVTIASLVERETAVPAERPLVASVFENRLSQGMPLMTDPAVIYGLELEKHWRGEIYADDLKHDTAYNTYLHKGLPPGPIANPGAASLRAAMQPAKTSYLYFVAAGANAQGESLFAETLEEHNRDVALYRRAIKRAEAR